MERIVSSLGHQPDGPWVFDDEVARVFDDMLRRSIPQLDTMRELVFAVGRRFVRPGTFVVDLGCSRGDALAPFVDAFGRDTRMLGVDVSAPMLAACAERFRAEIDGGGVSLLDLDLGLAGVYPDVDASLTLAVLTLQFLTVDARLRVLRDICTSTVAGGALIIVEKVLGGSTQADGMLVELYHDLKQSNGYTPEEIARKRLSLQGVLAPMTAAGNERLLAEAGFADVECFWRTLNFAAWVAVKPLGS